MTELQFDQVFKLLDKNKNCKMEPDEIVNLLIAYETWLYEKQNKAAMEDFYSDSKRTTLIGYSANIYERLLRVISGPQYELVMNIVTILNVSTVFILTLQET